MGSKSRKLILFLPLRGDPERGETYSADLLPLELLQIAAGPAAEGYEICLIDAMVEEDYLRKVLEACDGALLFASSCILGYQVWDGYRVAKAVRERFPKLPIVWGGWFPSVVPEMYFEAGVADVVGIGQGELTFLDVVRAIESGADLAQVPGLALERDGEIVYTPHRAVAGFDKFQSVPWYLLDYERYAERQAREPRHKVRYRMPIPADWPHDRPPRGFSHFSSFGCPTDCTFCCSPMLTGRRWKAIGGDALAEEIAELQERFRFDTLRFQDANWGVSEKRTREFSQGLIDRGVHVHWNATIEIETIMRYSEPTLDLVRDSGCHLLWLGAEAGTLETQERIKKHIDVEHIPQALGRLYERGIVAGTFWIIGYPGESRESMEATLRQAARVKRQFPGSASEVYPFRAIPGSEDFRAAIELGWQPPSSFEEWGECFEWKWHSHLTPLPPSVRRTWTRYSRTAAHYDQYVSEGSRAMRRVLSKIAGWRLARHDYRFPIEQKLFDLWVRASGQTAPGVSKD